MSGQTVSSLCRQSVEAWATDNRSATCWTTTDWRAQITTTSTPA